ncbi:TadE family protein [Sulfitobacter sp. HNIBRBA3233]|uniref:TadE/TadG family type IV pilus assembly protein n=1 Tax=Sulfitobacter marinivivus TaxID=3158558 RepID=UPI0032DFE682
MFNFGFGASADRSKSGWQRITSKVREFRGNEDGSQTVEAVIWFPIYMVVFAIILNLSMMFFTKSQMLRVAQDGNRAYSLGRMDATTDVENYIKAQFAYTRAALSVNSAIRDGFIVTEVTAPAIHLMPMSLMRGYFDDVTIGFVAQQIIEF